MEENRIKGKTILITGASAGFGEACARQLFGRGANLLLIARRFDRLERLKGALEADGGPSVDIFELDVRDRSAVKSFAAELNQSGATIDVLINNAGLASGFGKIQDGDFDDWDRMIDTNVKGLLNVTRCILPQMIERDSGHIVNIGSIAGHWVYPNGNVYNATKYAVRALNEAINIDLVGTQIRVSSVDPGAADTEFAVVRFHGDAEQAKTVYKGFTPLDAGDVADAVCYVLNVPPHVNIQNMVIMATDQRSPFVIHRKAD